MQRVTLGSKRPDPGTSLETEERESFSWLWTDKDSRNIHVEIRNSLKRDAEVSFQHVGYSGQIFGTEQLTIPAGARLRVAVGQTNQREKELEAHFPKGLECLPIVLLDRAHFPLAKVPR